MKGFAQADPPEWNELQRRALRELAESEGGTASALLRHLHQNKEHASVSEDTIERYLRQLNFSYKRCRYSLKTKMPLRMQAP